MSKKDGLTTTETIKKGFEGVTEEQETAKSEEYKTTEEQIEEVKNSGKGRYVIGLERKW